MLTDRLVVIGGSLSALLFSHKNNLPLIINHPNIPHRFQKINSLNMASLWKKLYFSLSLSGLNLMGDQTENLRLGDGELLAITKNLKHFNFKFTEAYVFCDKNINGLDKPLKKENNYDVFDWMIAKPCEKHDIEHLTSSGPLAMDVYFYPTERMYGMHKDQKDLLAVSSLKEKQLTDFEYSDTHTRYKVLKMMSEAGIKGKKNGISSRGQVNYLLNLEVQKREIKKSKMDSYKDTQFLKFRYDSVESLLGDKDNCHKYSLKINKYLNGKQSIY